MFKPKNCRFKPSYSCFSGCFPSLFVSITLIHQLNTCVGINVSDLRCKQPFKEPINNAERPLNVDNCTTWAGDRNGFADYVCGYLARLFTCLCVLNKYL